MRSLAGGHLEAIALGLLVFGLAFDPNGSYNDLLLLGITLALIAVCFLL